MQRFTAKPDGHASEFVENRYNKHASITLYASYDLLTHTGVLVSDGFTWNDVSMAALTQHNGFKQYYEMVDTEADPSPLIEKNHVAELPALPVDPTDPDIVAEGYEFSTDSLPEQLMRLVFTCQV